MQRSAASKQRKMKSSIQQLKRTFPQFNILVPLASARIRRCIPPPHLGRFSMHDISTAGIVLIVAVSKCSAMEASRRELSEDVSFGIGSLSVVEQSQLGKPPQGVCVMYTDEHGTVSIDHHILSVLPCVGNRDDSTIHDETKRPKPEKRKNREPREKNTRKKKRNYTNQIKTTKQKKTSKKRENIKPYCSRYKALPSGGVSQRVWTKKAIEA